ncbi:MAG: PD-(D/E)XK nuclease-like domain-containing protein, partial [Planctomycetota bacterium]
HVSASMLKTLDESPFKVGEILSGNHPEEKDCWRLGSATHCLTFEPDEFAKRYVRNKFDTKHRSKAFVAWEKEQLEAGRTILTKNEHDTATLCRDRLRSIPFIEALLESEGVCEESIRVSDPETGIPIRIRPDKLVFDVMGCNVIFDAKTIASLTKQAIRKALDHPSEWGRGYGIQSEHYQTGARVEYGGKWRVIFGFVETNWPHRACAVELDSRSRMDSQEKRTELLRQFEDRRRSGDWSEWKDQISTLTLPSVAKTKRGWKPL